MIAREGYLLIGGAVVIALVLVGVGLLISWPWSLLPILLGIGALGFTLYFFRDPQRTPPAEAAGGRLLLAPADGRIVEIEEVNEPLYLKCRARKVSIFLSPLSVHVNRVPADGVVEYDNYVSGDYLVAWHPKASEKNERSQLGMRHDSGYRILFKQIAGVMARRIVYHIGEGDRVRAGERFGIVKFGSRMDVIVPLDVDIDAEVGDRTRAGETILGRLPVPDAAAPALATDAKDSASS